MRAMFLVSPSGIVGALDVHLHEICCGMVISTKDGIEQYVIDRIELVCGITTGRTTPIDRRVFAGEYYNLYVSPVR